MEAFGRSSQEQSTRLSARIAPGLGALESTRTDDPLRPHIHLDTPMSPQVSVGMIIRYASHNLRFIYSTNTKNFKECPKVSTGESRRKHVPTPMHKFTRSLNPQVDHQNIHQVNHVNIPLSPQISTTRHTSSVLKSLKTQSDKIPSKIKLNSSQGDRARETS